MRLSKRKALEICIELWSWLAKSEDFRKGNWPGWKRNGGKYIRVENDCSLCEYDEYRRGQNKIYKPNCYYCPLKEELDYCDKNSLYTKWRMFSGDKSKYASQIRDVAIKALNELK